MTRYHDYLRWLYKGGRPNGFAKLQNRASAAVFARGVFPRRVASLEVKGRKSGRAVTLPIVIADLAGERYVVSMLGEAAHSSDAIMKTASAANISRRRPNASPSRP